MSNKVTVTDFVDRYISAKTTADKNKVIDSVIIRNYVPFIEKVSTIKILLEPAFHDVDGLKLPDEFCLHLNYHLTILTLYTDLEINQDRPEGDDSADKTAVSRAYDKLQSCNLWSAIFERIGVDCEELQRIKEMYLKNRRNQNELLPQFAKQISRFRKLAETVFKPLVDQIIGELSALSDAEKADLKSGLFKLIK